MGIKDTEVSLNTTEFKLFEKEKLVFGKKLEDVNPENLRQNLRKIEEIHP